MHNLSKDLSTYFKKLKMMLKFSENDILSWICTDGSIASKFAQY